MSGTNYMADIVRAWQDKIAASKMSEARKGFMDTARMCNEFFCGSMGAMWSDKFRNDYLGGMPAPKFKLTIAKAFELVAVMGPSVMWDYPGRVIKSLDRPELPRAIFGPEGDPSSDMEYEQYLLENQQDDEIRSAGDSMMQFYLNYAQREQPSGLTSHSHLAITEAIVKGRGCLWTDGYQYPGSGRTLTGSFFDSVDNLYLDPDARHADLSDCKWIARKRRNRYWELERKFGMPSGMLRDKAKQASHSSVAMHASETKKASLNQNDIIEWYEIYSKEGAGTRSLSHRPQMESALEEVAGDYVYLAIAEGLEYPLNFAPHFAPFATNDEAAEAFGWKVPYYKDGRWPVALLDFHRRPDSAWPIAPMAMGLGELVFLNTVMSCLMERTYESCRTILVGDKSLGDDLVNALKDGSFSGFVESNLGGKGDHAKRVSDYLEYLQSPQINGDVFAMIDYVSEMFDKRTGLNDLLYGGHAGGKVMRSSTDAAMMHENSSIRPDWMSRCCESWQTEVANLERIAAGWLVSGSDIKELVGDRGAEVWDSLIANADPEVYVRQMRATLEANSIKKPNKFRDNANIQQTVGYILPLMQTYMQATGDTGPINAYLQSIGEAMEQPTDSWMIPPLVPPQPEEPSPEQLAEQEMESQRQQVDDLKSEEDLRGKMLKNDRLEAEAEADMLSQMLSTAMAEPANNSL